MPLFRRGANGGDDRAAREAAAAEQAASLAALERGELPLRAQQRLAELGAGGGLFTSDLSVNEFALGAASGLRPVAQVMGSSIYHVGWQQSPGTWAGWQARGVSQELVTLSEAWNTARSRAFSRLAQEATLVRAHAVVGVRLTVGRHDWAAGAIEYVAVGTAVRIDGAAPTAEPVLTDLSGQEYFLLREAGYRPLGVVGATSVLYVVSGWQQRQVQGMFSSWANQELGDFTQGVYDARELALGRVSADARRQGAAGMVGVTLAHAVEEREASSGGSSRTDLIVTVHVLGTSIAAETETVSAVTPALTVNVSRDSHPAHVLGGNR
ncbi:MAG TPA: heavy metal-binding domain-containing protein [Gaiellaceae bacterium]